MRFKNTPQGKKAREVVAYLEADNQFKRELAAKKVYEGTVRTADPARRNGLLRSVAQRFEGTHFGKLAEEEAAAPRMN